MYRLTLTRRSYKPGYLWANESCTDDAIKCAHGSTTTLAGDIDPPTLDFPARVAILRKNLPLMISRLRTPDSVVIAFAQLYCLPRGPRGSFLDFLPMILTNPAPRFKIFEMLKDFDGACDMDMWLNFECSPKNIELIAGDSSAYRSLYRLALGVVPKELAKQALEYAYFDVDRRISAWSFADFLIEFDNDFDYLEAASRESEGLAGRLHGMELID